MVDSNDALTREVRALNVTLQAVNKRLADDYPKRTEIERRFQSRLDARKHVTRIILLCLLTVVACYALSTGVYSACFIGDDSPSVCKYAPGYEERLSRRDEINKKDRELDLRIQKLEQQLKNRK